jgi:phosphoglycolate phosphatase-like HAD superfamily hydrolase
MKICLFDMDGVLLESQGYHRALQETVRLAARALGYGDATLSVEGIAAFEAGGITSEWDEAAIVTARLLEEAWKDEPELGLPESFISQASHSGTPKPLPDLIALAESLSTPDMLVLHPIERAARYFFHKPGRTPGQEQILHDLILEARLAELSLTHRTFQELVLGSQEFSRVYGFQTELNCESYLLKYDRSYLPDDTAAELHAWLAQPEHAAAIITSRPSIPPAGVFSTPEAELGAKLVGLEGIPILGWGGMCWLGLQTHVNPQSFLKPSPVHALAGMRIAMGEPQETALTETADLVENGIAGAEWEKLQGADVYVFEDTPGGVRSLQGAAKVLGRLDVAIKVRCFGIAHQPIKVKALETCGAKVFSSLRDALEAADL